MTKKKSIQLSLRMDEDQHGRLVDVQEHISACSRGMKPDLMEIIRSVIGWGNPDLVTPEERAYLRGELAALGAPEGNDGPAVFLSQGGRCTICVAVAMTNAPHALHREHLCWSYSIGPLQRGHSRGKPSGTFKAVRLIVGMSWWRRAAVEPNG